MSRCSRLPEQRRRLQDYLLLTRQQRLLTTMSTPHVCQHSTVLCYVSLVRPQPYEATRPRARSGYSIRMLLRHRQRSAGWTTVHLRDLEPRCPCLISAIYSGLAEICVPKAQMPPTLWHNSSRLGLMETSLRVCTALSYHHGIVMPGVCRLSVLLRVLYVPVSASFSPV